MKRDKHLSTLGLATALGLLAFITGPTMSLAHQWANAIFYSGMFLVLTGLYRLSRKYGSGDLFAFSWGRIAHVLRSKKNANTADFPATYFDYLEGKKHKEYVVWIPLMIGFVLVLASFFLSSM